MTDLRALIHRMADELDRYRQLLTDDRRELHPLATEARAALAKPKPEAPTDIEIASILKAYAVVEPQMGVSRILHEKHFGNVACAVRARLGK